MRRKSIFKAFDGGHLDGALFRSRRAKAPQQDPSQRDRRDRTLRQTLWARRKGEAQPKPDKHV